MEGLKSEYKKLKLNVKEKGNSGRIQRKGDIASKEGVGFGDNLDLCGNRKGGITVDPQVKSFSNSAELVLSILT